MLRGSRISVHVLETQGRMWESAGLLTLEQPLDFSQLGRIVQLPKVLGLLGKILSLDGRVSLVGDNVRRRIVQCRDQ